MTSSGIPELLFIEELMGAGEDPRRIRRAARSGQLLRLRRGIYCTREEWDSADERSRHVARSRAVFAQLRMPAMVAGYSAAAVHDLHVLRPWPSEVSLLVPYRGGGTAEPGVVRSAARWDQGHGTGILGVTVTNLARTLFDVALVDGFAGGVAAMDSALHDGRITSTDLAAFLEGWNPRTGLQLCADVLAFSRSESGSFGESLARAAIHRLGFPTPVLQQRFDDDRGSMFVDFFWPEFSLVAEFDGKEKYVSDQYNGGDPGEVVWNEKRREDRLRRQVRRVVRLTTSDVQDARRLASLLESAGLPRRHPLAPKDTGARMSFAP